MKNLIFIVLVLLLETTVIAQSPQSFRYQAVARDNSGNVLANQAVSFRISILSGSVSGAVDYSEIHTGLLTNAFGLVELEIGKGTSEHGTFSSIEWGNNRYFVKVEMDPAGGTAYQVLSTSQLLSVPYALYARQAANGFSGDYYDLINKPLLFDGTWNNLTGKPTTLGGYGITNAMSTSHVANGITSTMITNWNSAYGWGNHAGLYKPLSYLPSWTEITAIPTGFADGIDNVDDADNSTTNEIQVLSLSGNNLSLSKSGGTVIIPGDNWGTDNVKTDASLTGNGTVASVLQIATNGVNSSKILDGSIDSADLAISSVTSEKLGNLSVSSDKIQTGAVSSDKLASNSVITAKIATGAVTGTKIAQEGATTGQVLKWSGTSWAPAVDAITLPFSGTATSDSPLFDINNLGTSGAISTFSSGNYGIWGESGNSTGIGVYGVNKTTGGTTYGVFGDVYSSSGFSGFFQGGKFYVQGNTGIGTQNPGAKLEVAGQVKITGGNPGAGKILTSDGAGLASWVSPSDTWLKNGNNVYYSSGNVGIGLSNPTGMMEIYGNSVDNYPTLLLSETDGYSRVSFRTMSASSKHWVLAGHTNLTDASSQWHLNYFDGSVGKNIFSVYGNSSIAFDGNVGIGTTTPSAKLEVAGQVKITGGTPGAGKVLTSDASGLGTWQSPELSPWVKNGSDIYYNSGNVAIGTTFPRYNLTIYHANNPLLGFYNSTSGTTGSDGFTIGTYSSGSPVWIWNWENSNMHFATNNLNRMIINADGHVSMMSYLDLNTDGIFGALYVAGKQALWWDGTYFSWGYGGQYNYFADKMFIGPDVVNPGTNMLVVNGDAAKPGGGSWLTWSDARLKNVHGNYLRGLNDIVKLQPVSFSYKKGNKLNLPCDKDYVGFVAQDVQKFFPETVTENKDGYLEFDMHLVNVAVINALKELKTENDLLKAKISSLESRFEEIAAILNASVKN